MVSLETDAIKAPRGARVGVEWWHVRRFARIELEPGNLGPAPNSKANRKRRFECIEDSSWLR